MRKLFLLLSICSLPFGALVSTADADTFIGEFCWQKVPFVDIVKLALSQGTSLITANGVQFVNGVYSLPFTGTLFTIGNQAILGGVFSGDSVHFGGSVALTETVTLSVSAANGPGTLVGIDGKFAATPSTWTFVACPSGPTTHFRDSSAPAQGE